MKKIIKNLSVMPLIVGCIAFMPTQAVAGRATFNATVSPSVLKLSVNAQGGITGNRHFTVSVTRSQVGSSAACNKIKFIDVVKGGSRGNPTIGNLELGRRGLCYFKDKRILATPWEDEDIRSVCKGVSGTQRLVSDGLVAAYRQSGMNSAFLESWKQGNYNGSPTPGVPGAKNVKQIHFAADVTCVQQRRLRVDYPRVGRFGNGQSRTDSATTRSRVGKPTGASSGARTTAVPSHPGKKSFDPRKQRAWSKTKASSIKGCKSQNGQIVCKKPVKQAASPGVNKMRGGVPVMRPMAETCEWTCKVQCSGEGSRRKCVWVCQGSGPECEGTPFP